MPCPYKYPIFRLNQPAHEAGVVFGEGRPAFIADFDPDVGAAEIGDVEHGTLREVADIQSGFAGAGAHIHLCDGHDDLRGCTSLEHAKLLSGRGIGHPTVAADLHPDVAACQIEHGRLRADLEAARDVVVGAGAFADVDGGRDFDAVAVGCG